MKKNAKGQWQWQCQATAAPVDRLKKRELNRIFNRYLV
jgi:hypothetical protein